MQFLLDTNICIFIADRQPVGVLRQLQRLRPGDVVMSAVTYAELVAGAAMSRHPEENLDRLERLARLIPVQPFSSASAREYGRIRAHLEHRGIPLGAHDMLIAAHALSLRLVLVTNNLWEFKRVPDLRVENWLQQ